MTRLSTLALAAVLGLCLPAIAQEKTIPPAGASVPKAAPEPDPDPAVLKAMRSRVFVIQHCDAEHLLNLLRTLGSGVRGASLTARKESDVNAISVRDFPENLATIEEAVKRLDVPTASDQAPNVELHIQVLFASKAPLSDSDIPEDLRKVLVALKGTLVYRGFTPVANFVQRVQVPTNRSIDGSGLVEPKTGSPEGSKDSSMLNVGWWAMGLKLDEPKDGPAFIRIGDFRLYLREDGPKGTQTLASFDTALSLKEGEMVVVGTSVVKDRGLIVVVSARRVR